MARILYIRLSAIFGGDFCLKACIQNCFFKKIALIQHVIMLTQFNGKCGTAIAIYSKKGKIFYLF